ncbi:phosphonate metabolism transcriptional regulator PhnF [Rhodalgimonas zhirmunskyi]|uniref:Phosphonate metabolism transcriptional regulator PhnF n=1 Tax=Rhodalgimonas zhirmunskyi TaxID=2964767 RepID=A0AAJ1X5E7_9RHOB|nr:phosphonate metabolism transcriptional regulator PhnF [Rhodoalgimonas zhirmunskyi]MDQ2094461.1 phosphonate metabolism transcriptional regulator PhnF [Rhodoalgimonas zhirmunskyi]
MARTPIWKTIAATLEGEIAAGHYRAGDKLPTEAALAGRFGVNRHTVRRALADLGERGITRSRRGAGVFVEAAPTEYPIGRRVRFHRAIEATGKLPTKQVLHVDTRACDADEAGALHLTAGDRVVVYEGLSLSEGTPIAHFISVFPEARVPNMAATLGEVTSVTEALRRNGISDYTRSETRLTATRANATQALHLRLREGDPLLKTVGLNLCPEGRPIERGLTWFAGDRVTLTVRSD